MNNVSILVKSSPAAASPQLLILIAAIAVPHAALSATTS